MRQPLAYARGTVPVTGKEVWRPKCYPVTPRSFDKAHLSRRQESNLLATRSHNSFTDYRRPIRPLRAGIRAKPIDATKGKERATPQLKDILKLERPARPKNPSLFCVRIFGSGNIRSRKTIDA